jgi:N-acetyl sugar amidotransferase
MSLKGQVCTRGLWDDSIPGIVYDKNGVSNYAILFDKLVDAYPRGERGLNDWNKVVEKIKFKGLKNRYDCIIGVSGGTDSSYLLHLSKHYGLRPLAVNLDNGWNSDISVKNIRKMTEALNIDLETYVIDYEEVKDLLRAYMNAGLPWIDMPTDLAIKAILYKIANREKIKYILRGNDFRSEGTQPREWTYGDGRQLKYIHRKFGICKLKTFPNYTLPDLLYFSLMKGIKSIYPFYYLDYQKKNAQTFLQDNFKWEYYGGHHFENTFTRFAISYWLYEKFGIDKRKITLSAQVMSGEISREEGVDILRTNPYDDSDKNRMLEYVIKKLDFTIEEFERILKSPNKSFYDYPSNYKLIDSLNYISKPVLQRVFIHKPQSVFQAEMRKEEQSDK